MSATETITAPVPVEEVKVDTVAADQPSEPVVCRPMFSVCLSSPGCDSGN